MPNGEPFVLTFARLALAPRPPGIARRFEPDVELLQASFDQAFERFRRGTEVEFLGDPLAVVSDADVSEASISVQEK